MDNVALTAPTTRPSSNGHTPNAAANGQQISGPPDLYLNDDGEGLGVAIARLQVARAKRSGESRRQGGAQ